MRFHYAHKPQLIFPSENIFKGSEHQAFCYASYGNTVQMSLAAGFDYFQLGTVPGGKFSGLSEFY